jgi:transcriptional regulator with XRE-family HTH domain
MHAENGDSPFAQQLRDLRERSGMTLRALQEATFVSDSALSRYLSGHTVPQWSIVVVICAELGVDAGSLRSAWEQARLRRRRHGPAAPPAQRLADTHAKIGHSLTIIDSDVAAALTMLQSGEGRPVTDLLRRVQRTSQEAAAQLRTLREPSAVARE